MAWLKDGVIHIYDSKTDSMRPIKVQDVNALEAWTQLVAPKLKALDPELSEKARLLYVSELEQSDAS